jgi:SAM-dependent methyltransferase
MVGRSADTARAANEYRAAGADERRLWALEALCDPMTISVLGRVGLSRQWRCLEAGAGRGSIARWLSTQCLHGSVVATDIDLRHLTNLNAPNLEVRRHDLVDGPGFPQSSFDLIHARALLVHLPDRQAVLERATGWLAPRGWLVLEEPIMFLPIGSAQDPCLCQALSAFERLLAYQLGSDFQWPRRLPAALRAAGLIDVDVTAWLAMAVDGGAVSEFWRINLAELAPDLVSSGLVDAGTLRQACMALDDPGYLDFTLGFVCAWGRQPEPSVPDRGPTYGP